MNEENSILFSIENSIATITINRPKVRNAFDDKLIANLNTLLDKVNNDDTIKALVLTGSGEHFSAGADLNWMKNMINFSFDENQKDAGALATLLEKLNNLEKPTIALIKGGVFGGAVGLVACCDIAICEENAKFCLSEVKLGISPAVISPYVIASIGEKNARRFMLTAELFSAKCAKDIGLIHIICSNDELSNKLNDILKNIKRNGPIAIKTTKKLILDLVNNSYKGNLMEYTTKVISELRVSPEGQEGLSSFLEKRNPNWSK